MKYALLFLLCLSCFGEETRTKIAVIDTGLTPGELTNYLCQDGHKDFTGGDSIEDVHGHGTNVAGIIADYIDPNKTCILVIKYWNPESFINRVFHINGNVYNLTEGINYAIEQHAKYINISSGGINPDSKEKRAIAKALANDIRVIVSAGNEGMDLSKDCSYFPACYSFHSYNYYVVGNISGNGSKVPSSNYNGPVNQYEIGVIVCANSLVTEASRKCMSGTSQSTAVFTGKLVRKETNEETFKNQKR